MIYAYRPYSATIQGSGPSTVYARQWDKIDERGDNKIDSRKQVISDLSIFTNELQERQHEIVLAIDTTEDFNPGKNDLQN